MTFDKEFVEKCAYDPELRKIIYAIAGMKEEEKMKFRKKMRLYFLNKSSVEDRKAMEFYELLLKENNAIELKKCIEGLRSG